MKLQDIKYSVLPTKSKRYTEVDRSKGQRFVKHYFKRRNGWENTSLKKFNRDENEKFFPLERNFIKSLGIEDKRLIAFILMLKTYNEESRIYNYSPYRLSKQIKVSSYNINLLVIKLIRLGYGYINERGDLVLASLERIFTTTRTRHAGITVHKDDTLQNVIDKLLYITLEGHFINQDFAKKTKSNDLKKQADIESGKFIPTHELEEWKQNRKKYEKLLRGDVVEANYLGMRRLARLFNSSIDYAWKFIVRQRNSNLIETSPNVLLLMGFYKDEYFNAELFKLAQEKRAGHVYLAHNMVYAYLGTNIKLNDEYVNKNRFRYEQKENSPCIPLESPTILL